MNRMLMAWLMLLVGVLGAHAAAYDRETPRYIILMDGSSSMGNRRELALQMVSEIIGTGAKGRFENGNEFALWHLGGSVQPLYLGWRKWETEQCRDLAARSVVEFERMKLDRTANLDTAITQLAQAARTNNVLTAFLITDGSQVIYGTPFDLPISTIFFQHTEDFGKAKKPFVLSLFLRDGNFVAWAIDAAEPGVELTVPNLPKRPRKDDAPPAERKPPVAKSTPPPAPKPPVKMAPPIIVIHTNPPPPAPTPKPEPVAPPVTPVPPVTKPEPSTPFVETSKPAVITPPAPTTTPPPTTVAKVESETKVAPPTSPKVTPTPPAPTPVETKTEPTPKAVLVEPAPPVSNPSIVSMAPTTSTPSNAPARKAIATVDPGTPQSSKALLTIAVLFFLGGAAFFALNFRRSRSTGSASLISQSLDRERKP